MATIAEASPFIACGPDYAHAGPLSLPFPPADLEGTLTSLCHGSSGPEHSDVFLPSLPWQSSEWDISENFPRYPEGNLQNPPMESVISGNEGSLNTSLWDYPNHQPTLGREYSPSIVSSSTSDPLMSTSSAASSASSASLASSASSASSAPSLSPPALQLPKAPVAAKKQTRTRKNSSAEGGVAKRPRRPKTDEEQEASRMRIREKNRIAADKCRGRQRIAMERLNLKHDSLEYENQQLSKMLKDLVAERIVLKNMLLEHGNCGCELIENYLRESAVRWVKQVESQAVNVEAA
ncbi:uncharacterized protein TrAFT101_007898 [Trichoderma asperellum]|uniref:BZIP domain-containing protein n=1 Tax=Trichoderma asperellum (strain ATCC 204424 / CBS 433.97 / NBRC 101777) TaxID=1042311 RepID=A0A2T3Z3C9_TRIA4|nr:hypothetical protein M441DRAFT_70440 [Trichoderma asperellum CBS 433.97]PTB39304.1 hypothetical protein M441DRAFT_70440 [Trichoderma asperellum CBS 433.97]UKZ92966.1 hypothetical protein TrAFT101_007898 [Trichoderma asperellum]